MARNRIREFRLEADLTLEELAEIVGLSHSQVQRIETGKRGLKLPIAERFAAALKRRPEEILGMTSQQNAATHHYTGGSFAEDAVPYVETAGERLRLQPRKGENIDPWRITSDAVARAGVRAGQIRFVDISAEAVDNVQPLQCVIAQIYGGGPEGRTVTVVRQYVPPSLLITNSETVSELPLDIDKGDAYIKGVILDDYAPSTRT